MIPPPAIAVCTPTLAERLSVALNRFSQELRGQTVRVVISAVLLMRIQRYFRRLTARFARLVALAQAGAQGGRRPGNCRPRAPRAGRGPRPRPTPRGQHLRPRHRHLPRAR